MERKIPESLIKFVQSLPANEKMMLIDADSYLEILAEDCNTVVRQVAKRKLYEKEMLDAGLESVRLCVKCLENANDFNITKVHAEPDYARIVGEAIISMVSQKPDFMIKEAIRFMYVTLEDEQSEKEEFLRYGSFDNVMSTVVAGMKKGCMFYTFTETLAASAFGGDDDVFHRTYEKLKERLRDLYEASLIDFEYAKKLFLSYYGLE